jgi:hypothetical protein
MKKGLGEDSMKVRILSKDNGDVSKDAEIHVLPLLHHNRASSASGR